MKPIYYDSTVDNWQTCRDEMNEHGSIFLAGPTPRDNRSESWRPHALKALEEFCFEGWVFVPEWNPNITPLETIAAVERETIYEWEQEALEAAHVIAFWVPRDMQRMPGLTTNIEFGMWMMSGKCVFGAPKMAEDVNYMRYVCEKQGIKQSQTLPGTMHLAVMMNAFRIHNDKPQAERKAALGFA